MKIRKSHTSLLLLRNQSTFVRFLLTFIAISAVLVINHNLPVISERPVLLVFNFSVLVSAIYLGIDCGIFATWIILFVLNVFLLSASWIKNPLGALLLNVDFLAVTVIYLWILQCFLKLNTSLRHNQEDLQYAQELGRIGSWRVTKQYAKIAWSEGVRRLYEVPGDLPMTYDIYLAAIHPDDKTFADQQWQAALQGEPYDTKHRIIIGKKVKWVREKAVLEFTKQGKLSGGLGIIQDITEQVDKEQAWQHQLALQDQLAKVAKSVPGVIHSLRLSPDGRISMPYASAYVETLYGVQYESFKDDFTSMFTRIPEEDIANVQLTMNQSARSLKPWHAIFRYQHPIQGIIWLECHSIPLQEADGSILWHGYIQNVTQRVQNEKILIDLNHDLKNKIEEFQAIFDTAPIGLAVASDPTGRHIAGNKMNEKIFGLPTRSDLSKKDEMLSGCTAFQGHRKLAIEELPMQRAIKGETITNFLLTCKRSDNKIMTILCNAKPLLDQYGTPRGAVCAFLDVSDSIKAKQLAILQNQIDKTNREQVAFHTAGMIAHELNQPLAAITYYADAAIYLLKNPSFKAEKLQQILEKSCTQTLRVGAIFNELTEFLNKGEINAEAFDLNNCINEAVELYKSQEHFNAIKIKMNLDKTLPCAWGNKIQITKVLLQLLKNGFEAQADMNLQLPHITVTSTTYDNHDSNMALVIVKDFGIGLVNDNTLETIFKPFRSSKQEGLGLGLTISRAEIEVNGGKLWAQKNTDNGLSFFFTLPLLSSSS